MKQSAVHIPRELALCNKLTTQPLLLFTPKPSTVREFFSTWKERVTQMHNLSCMHNPLLLTKDCDGWCNWSAFSVFASHETPIFQVQGLLPVAVSVADHILGKIFIWSSVCHYFASNVFVSVWSEYVKIKERLPVCKFLHKLYVSDYAHRCIVEEWTVQREKHLFLAYIYFFVTFVNIFFNMCHSLIPLQHIKPINKIRSKPENLLININCYVLFNPEDIREDAFTVKAIW